jgi:hypothetical protein
MMKKKLALTLCVFATLMISPASAHARHHRHSHHASSHAHLRAHGPTHRHAYAGAAHHGRWHVRRYAGRRHGLRLARWHGSTARAGRPAAWCGWWLGQHLGLSDRRLWLARNWASVGSNAGGPSIGAVVVWRHHVGVITGRAGSQWIIKSGNDGHGVRERPRSISGAIAFRHVGGMTGS